MCRTSCGCFFEPLHLKPYFSKSTLWEIVFWFCVEGEGIWECSTVGVSWFCGLLFEFGPLFYLMPTSRCDAVNDVQSRTSEAWAVSCKKRFRANVLVWGLPKSFTTLV